MTAPTSPYATTAQVAALVPLLIGGASDFTTSTVPSKASVTQMIAWVSAQIDMVFRAAGYKVPFVVLDGETWPTDQTSYLAMLTSLGAAAFVAGHQRKPAPALAPGREGAAGNIYQKLFDEQLNIIYNPTLQRSLVALRANFYAGTPAEWTLSEPAGPNLDFMAGIFDPTRYGTFQALTELTQRVHNTIAELSPEWDYLYGYESLNVGLGGIG